MDKEPRERNQIAFILLLFGVILVLGALLLFQMQDKTNDSGEITAGLKNKMRSKEYEKSVNYHVSEVYSKSKLKEKIIEYQNKKEAPLISKTNEEVAYLYDGDRATLDGENWGNLVGKDLKGIRRERTLDTPEQKIRDEVIQDQRDSVQNTANQEAYAQQFIENARRDGYELTLDSEYRITDVKKIKKNRNPSLFDNSESELGSGASR